MLKRKLMQCKDNKADAREQIIYKFHMIKTLINQKTINVNVF